MKQGQEEEVKFPKFSNLENIFDNLTITSGGGEDDHHNNRLHTIHSLHVSSPKQVSLTLHTPL
jgi:hypothetical protein